MAFALRAACRLSASTKGLVHRCCSERARLWSADIHVYKVQNFSCQHAVGVSCFFSPVPS